MSSSGARCTPSWIADGFPEVSQSSSVDNGAAAFDLWLWSNVPDDVAFVSFGRSDGRQFWQQPVAGLAAFPIGAGAPVDGTVTTSDRDGRTLATMDAWPRRDDSSEVSVPTATSVRLTVDQARTLRELSDEVLTDCLIAAGAEFDSGMVGTISDPSVDPERVWDLCVRTTQLSVEAAARQLDAG